MGFTDEVWRVWRAQELVGEIAIEKADFPWLYGRFTAGPAFTEVRHLFARELELAAFDDAEHWAEWEKVYDEIAAAVSLASPDGPVPEFLLHVDGDRAWFRWNDEPFDDDA